MILSRFYMWDYDNKLHAEKFSKGWWIGFGMRVRISRTLINIIYEDIE